MPKQLLSGGFSRFGVGIALLLVAGVVLDRCAERRGRPAAFVDAERIWIDRPAERDAAGEPVAFWAIKDFALAEEQLERGAQTARLVVLADPGAQVYINGLLVHSTEFQAGQPITPLRVGPLLQRSNRIVLEARSDVGAGGLMAALWIAMPNGLGKHDSTESRPSDLVWVTDDDWRTTTVADRFVLSGHLPLATIDDLSPVKVWSRLDLGRWRPLEVSDHSVELSWPSRRTKAVLPDDRQLWRGQPFEVGETEPWPDGVVLTFGSTVRGCLGLKGADLFGRRVFFFEDRETLDNLRGPKDWVERQGLVWTHRTERVLALDGAAVWLDATERSFQTVFLEGHSTSATGDTAWVQPCAGAPADIPQQRLLARRAPDKGSS